MKLEKQSYQILDRGKIELVGHTELLGVNKQIIRMRDSFYVSVCDLLEQGNEVSLYNYYNPINSDLIREYSKNKEKNNGAIIAKIIDFNEEGPILEGESLKQVKVNKMFNVFLEEIEISDLEKSIAFNEINISVANLIEWMSKEFYSGKLTEEEIESYQRLFFRKIKLPN